MSGLRDGVCVGRFASLRCSHSQPASHFAYCILFVVLPCRSSVTNGPDGLMALGSPTEAACLVLAQKGGVTKDSAPHMKKLVEFPFESSLKTMSVVYIDKVRALGLWGFGGGVALGSSSLE